VARSRPSAGEAPEHPRWRRAEDFSEGGCGDSAHARRAGVPDLGRFRDELAGHTHRPAIEEAIARGSDSGVTGTPTFFVSGVRYDGALDERALGQALIDAAEQRVRPR
jgi:protein-disulfide isomerase